MLFFFIGSSKRENGRFINDILQFAEFSVSDDSIRGILRRQLLPAYLHFVTLSQNKNARVG
jgi:hypothetical protein